jgi:hypothetical protein
VNENPNIPSMLLYRKFSIIGTCTQPVLFRHVTFLLIPSRVYFPSLGLWTKIKAQRRGSISCPVDPAASIISVRLILRLWYKHASTIFNCPSNRVIRISQYFPNSLSITKVHSRFKFNTTLQFITFKTRWIFHKSPIDNK